jgi:hypothetical protein
MAANVPSKVTSWSSRFNLPWFNRSHRRMTRKKHVHQSEETYTRMRRRTPEWGAKKSNKESDWARYNSLKKKLWQDLAVAKNDYVSGYLTDNIQENPKTFWSFIKKSKSDGSVGIPDLKIGGKLTGDPSAKANGLNQQFCNVFTNEDLSSLPILAKRIPSSASPIRSIEICPQDVVKQILQLKRQDLTTWILKMLSKELDHVLTDLFQSSLDQATLPTVNYRPISLTSVVCKVLEHIVHSHMNRTIF